MILILSNLEDTHVEMVLPKLEDRRVDYLWFDPAQFPSEAQINFGCSTAGLIERTLTYRGRIYDLSTVTAVWYRRPGSPTAGADIVDETHRTYVDLVSQRCLGGVWETLDCRWLPGKPMVDRMAHNKLLQLVLASRLGFLVPNTLITNTPSRFLEFYADCESRIVGKSLAQMEVMRGGEMHMLTFTQPVLRRDALRAQAIRHAPVIFQKYVPKRVELRVTIVGRRALTAEIASQDNRSTLHDFRHNDDGTVRYRPYDLPAEIERRCLAMAESLGLTYGAIDLILTPEGDYVFLEINSNGQWGWVESLSGLPIADAVADFLIDG